MTLAFVPSVRPSHDGLALAAWTALLTCACEAGSLASVRRLWTTKEDGAALYARGVACNVVNNGVLGPAAYEAVRVGFLAPATTTHGGPIEFVAVLACLLACQSVGYYLAHRALHTRRLYWAHRFHHRFGHGTTVPVSANAVSAVEYAIAYLLPFVAGASLLRPREDAFFWSVAIVSCSNVLIHTPWLADVGERWVPWVFVSTADHLAHHRHLTSHYAAPTWSIDRLLERGSKSWRGPRADAEGR
jgi:sterol desaturase/sphingolipid hydroxylase (fatty acid hydroxylase superfamily)